MKELFRKFKELRLKNCADHITEMIEASSAKNLSPRETIERILDLELEVRERARINQRFKQAGLDEKVTIDGLDFNHHPSRKNYKSLIVNFMDLTFIQKRKDIILIGNPGVGKSHLAMCFAYVVTQKGIKTLFTTAMDMINHLITAEANHSLLKNLTFINLRIYLLSMKSVIFPLAGRDHICFSRLSTQGAPKNPL